MLITQLFTETSENQAPTLLPPGSGLSRTGVISYHPVQDGPIPGSSRTKVQYVNPDEIQESPIEQRSGLHVDHAGDLPADQQVDGEQPSMLTRTGGEHTAPETEFTPDEKLDLLFDPGLIPANARAGLPAEYHVCPWRSRI